MTGIFKKLLLKKETPFLSKIVNFRHKIAWISERKAHSQKPRYTCLIICHKEVPPAVLVKSRTRTLDHLLVSEECRLRIDPILSNGTSERPRRAQSRHSMEYPWAAKHFYARQKEAKIPCGKYRICNLLAFFGNDAWLINSRTYECSGDTRTLAFTRVYSSGVVAKKRQEIVEPMAWISCSILI